jgi:hypothetical protein
MRVILNDKEIVFPSSLSEITLGQRIAFQEQYGNDLDKMQESIMKMEDGADKELEIMEFSMEKMYRTFAFFANTTVEAIKESKFIQKVMNIYYSCLAVLFEEEKNLEPQYEFLFKGEMWYLAPPLLKHGDPKTFGEVIDSKQIVQDMIKLGKGKWEAMLRLAAIYLRKKDEDYQEEFLYDDSDRLKLMRELPMDIAMQVGFFLSDSMNFYLDTSMSLGSQERRQPVVT